MSIKLVKLVLFVSIVLFATSGEAGLYRCTMSDGNTAYSDRPCSSGKQAVMVEDRKPPEISTKKGKELWNQCAKLPKDAPERDECFDRAGCYLSSSAGIDKFDTCIARTAQATQKKKNAFEETNKEITKRLSALSACFRKEDRCQAADYQRNLKCLPPVYAEELFGSASNTQSVGGREFIYYNVPIHNGTGFAPKRLQLVIGGYCNDLPLEGGVSRISEINVW